MEFKAEHTVRKILKYIVIAAIVVLVLLWFIGGGVGKIVDKARGFQIGSVTDVFSLSKAFENFRLPWQIEMPTVSVQSVSNGDSSGGMYGVSDGSGDAHAGTQSSYVGQVAIGQGAARTQSTTGQYIELRSAHGQPINLSGWSLESAVSGARVLVPEAAPLFMMGSVNAVGAITLSPGGTATIVTGPSPVGVSFQENMCTGYLGTLQPFVPPLNTQCPAPLSVIPRTAESETRLGTSCFQYLSSLSPCTFPKNPPTSLSAACKSEIQNKLSYNGCVAQYKNSAGFASGSWRVYLARGAPLWGVDHDIIRLLDNEGRVVNALNY